MTNPFPPPAVTPPPPPEPVELKARTRKAVEQDPAAARRLLAEGHWLADPLWESWRPAWEELGADMKVLVAAASALDRELWLWVAGERQWEEMAALLYGRVARQRPGAASTNG